MTRPLRRRDFEMMEWLCDHCPRGFIAVPVSVISAVVRDNDLRTVKWLRGRGYPTSEDDGGYSLECAMDHTSSLEMLQFLHENPRERCAVRALELAAERGNLEMLQILKQHCREDMCSVRAIETAAKFGHVDVLRMLHEGDARPWSSSMMDDAATRGHLEVVRFLHEDRTEGCTTDAMDYAARFGYVEIVQFLHENRPLRTITLRSSPSCLRIVKAVHIQESPQSVSNDPERQIGSLLPDSVDQRSTKRARRKFRFLTCQPDHLKLTNHGGQVGNQSDGSANSGGPPQQTDIIEDGFILFLQSSPAHFFSGFNQHFASSFIKCKKNSARSVTAEAMADAMGTPRGSARGRVMRHQLLSEAPVSPEANAALAVLTDPTLWRTITSLMTGWPFPVYQFWKERVSKHRLRVQRWERATLRFPQKRGAIAHVAIIEDNQRVLEMAYELRKIQEDPVASDSLTFKHVMACAARYGRLEMLQWMAEMATKESEWWVWEQGLVLQALQTRRFEAMSFLRDHFPIECTRVAFQLRAKAAEENDLELMKWFCDHNYQCEDQGFFAMHYAMDHAVSLEMLQLMHGYPQVRCSTLAMDRAAVLLGDLEMVKFLHENRSEGCTAHAMDLAAGNGHLEVVQFLHEHRREGCTSRAMDTALRNGHPEVVAFLSENRTEGDSNSVPDGV